MVMAFFSINDFELGELNKKPTDPGLITISWLQNNVLWGERGSNPHDVTIDGF